MYIYRRSGIFGVKIFSSFALAPKIRNKIFAQNTKIKQPMKIRCAKNLIDPKMDNMKISRSTVIQSIYVNDNMRGLAW